MKNISQPAFKFTALALATGVFLALRALAAPEAGLIDVDAWLSREVPLAQAYLNANISPKTPGYPAGFVIAAPWVVPGVQDYRYHWIRDAALVMDTAVTAYVRPRDAAEKSHAFEQLKAYAAFSKQNQTAPEPDGDEKVGLGEVKFNPDGSRFTKWMRPQNDGPALRAITFIRFARQLIAEGSLDSARHLYDGSVAGKQGLAAPGVIQADLDYLRAHWKDPSFDPWEEVKGQHFYNNLAQRKALLDGAALARALGRGTDARLNRETAREIEAAVSAHWIAAGQKTPVGTVSRGQLWDTFDRVHGADYKASGLDVSEILGALHAHNDGDARGDRFFSPSDPRVLKTSAELARAFRAEFPVSSQTPDGSGYGTPIGRYPFDKYNGYDASVGGNPWYLATAAFAELYYRAADEWKTDGKIVVSPIDAEFLRSLTASTLRDGEVVSAADPRFAELVTSIRALGDTYLRQVALRAGEGGHLTEEFNRNDGKPQGAEDLSWSYASILTAAAHRHR